MACIFYIESVLDDPTGHLFAIEIRGVLNEYWQFEMTVEFFMSRMYGMY